MATIPSEAHAQLLERRERIEGLISRAGRGRQLEDLLREIDDALARLSAGTFGLCETCHDAIEPERLQADPLVRFCLDHLTPSESRALEKDLELAARVQVTLLPPHEMSADGWQTAYHYDPQSTVSGDYVDIIRTGADKTQMLFLFGDIAGKGVAASMLMAHLHASVRTLADLGFPPGQMMERANRIFCESTMSNHYATLVCGRLGRGGDVELLNAGHCSPLLLQAGRVTMLEPTSVPVGLFCVEEFASRQLTLGSGDSLVLYTDGITEAFNASGEQYGTDRLARTAFAHRADAPRDLVAACLEDMRAFRGAAEKTDDVTVMVIRRQQAA